MVTRFLLGHTVDRVVTSLVGVGRSRWSVMAKRLTVTIEDQASGNFSGVTAY